MMLDEHMYAYPRRWTLPLELVSLLAVGLATFGFLRALLNYVVGNQRLLPVAKQPAWLRDAFRWSQANGSIVGSATGLIRPLLWLLLALIITEFLRNLLPAVRTSSRGMLVQWSGGWVPVKWEGLRAMRITDAGKGEKFVVLAQTDKGQLTGWHRVYSLLYRFGWRRGFLITSAMTNGEDLIKDVMEELERLSKLGMSAPVAVDERHPSPLFRLLLGQRSVPLPPAQPAAMSDRVVAEYKPGVASALFAATVLIGGLAAWQYIRSWITFLYYQFPSLRTSTLQGLAQGGVVWPWGILIGAHLGVLAAAVVIGLLYHLFPSVSADRLGITLTAFGQTQQLNWSNVRVVKATTLAEDKHIVLIESEPKSLPWWYRIGPLAYEGGLGRGGVVWPNAENFEPLMQRIALELTRQPVTEGSGPRLRDDATGWLMMLVTRPAEALDKLVLNEDAPPDEAEGPQGLIRQRLMHELPKMLWIALLPALILLASRILLRGDFNPRLIGLFILTTLWGLAEWPLVGLVAKALDEMVGTGTKEYQGMYLYPTSQLPRLLPLAGALVLTLLGFPVLALFVWAAGIAWSAVLTAGLWEALYGWRGGSLIGGAAMGVIFQLMTLAAVAAVR